ncbi:conserved hypothetical protein [Crenothrix polyspora]|uniref:Uncharacterized protein n=1 Tax=Crenothrix polyspora TaxID=360316 RepID=A0A1R4H363_9GAMM|nr:hypothetical protein [Crenothrix polyspora]SJM90669.1 conserved hypothetical protein [Crenothrix polyspora]
MHTIELVNRDIEFLTIEKFMSLTAKEKSKIQSVKIIPPSLDRDDFGKIQVKYKVPSYRVAGIS